MNDNLSDRADAIEEVATELRADVARLRSTARIRVYVLGGILAVLVLAVVGLGVRVSQNADANERSARLTASFVCPASSLLVGGYVPGTRPLGGQDEYARAIEGMRQARAEYGCTEPLVPPRLDSIPSTEGSP